MKRITLILFVSAAAVVAVLAGVMVLRKYNRGKVIEATAPSAGHVNVRVETAHTQDVARALYAAGDIESPCVVDIVPKVGGVLEGYLRKNGDVLKEGDPVEEGEQVAVIEHAALDAVAVQADAALKVAQAVVRQAEINYNRLKKDRERVENLYSQGSVSEQQRDQAVSASEAAEAALNLALAQQDSGQAAVNLARLSRQDAFVKTPIAGVLVRTYVDRGNLVGPGRPVMRVASMNPVRVTAEIGEQNISFFAGGPVSAVVTVDACPGKVFNCSAVLKRPDVNRMSRTATVEMELPNAHGVLKPGMFARVRLVLEQKTGVLAVPESALVRNGTTCLFVIEGGKAVKRDVTLGLSDGLLTEIIAGISPGEQIVIAGAQAISDGEDVMAAGKANE